MEYNEELILDLNSNNAYTTIGAKQGDADTRNVWVRLTSNGEDYIIPDNATAYFRFRKPDGKVIVNRARVENNKIQLVFTRQTLAVAGRGYGDITLQAGSQILSSVAFIVIIMASPNIGDQLVSSSEFSELIDVVGDAHTLINEAEAWARGTRGGEPVVSIDDVSISTTSEIIYDLSVNTTQLFSIIKHEYGVYRKLTFNYEGTADEAGDWKLIIEYYNGNIVKESNSLLLSNLFEYGISFKTSNELNPSHNDKIIVEVREKDSTAEHNAKYYADLAAQKQEAIVNLTVDAEAAYADEFADYKNYYINDYVWYDANDGNGKLLYRFIMNHDAGPWDEDEVTNEIIAEKTEQGSHDHIHLKLPQGPRGDVNFVSFDIDPMSGQLVMTAPDYTNPRVDFFINDDGKLCGTILD